MRRRRKDDESMVGRAARWWRDWEERLADRLGEKQLKL